MPRGHCLVHYHIIIYLEGIVHPDEQDSGPEYILLGAQQRVSYPARGTYHLFPILFHARRLRYDDDEPV